MPGNHASGRVSGLVQLLPKVIDLKQDYVINTPPQVSTPRFPRSAQDAAGVQLVPDQTFMLNNLIDRLPNVASLQDKSAVLKGLNMPKVFRNWEGHLVTRARSFDASNYTDIARSLSALYRHAFSERPSLRFSLAPNEKPVWRVSGRPRS